MKVAVGFKPTESNPPDHFAELRRLTGGSTSQTAFHFHNPKLNFRLTYSALRVAFI